MIDPDLFSRKVDVSTFIWIYNEISLKQTTLGPQEIACFMEMFALVEGLPKMLVSQKLTFICYYEQSNLKNSGIIGLSIQKIDE